MSAGVVDLDEWRGDADPGDPPAGRFDDEPPKATPEASALEVVERSFRYLPADAMSIKPADRKYLLRRGGEGALALGKVAMLLGQGGVGKTLIECELALAVASGKSALGFDVQTSGGVLLALAEEDEMEIRRRLYSAANALELSDSERREAAGRIVALPLAGIDTSLMSSDGQTICVTALVPLLRRKLEEMGIDWSLVILDPLARLAGADAEKDAHAATRFVEVAESFTTVRGTPTVLVAHHTTKLARRADGPTGADAARGATALTDAARWVANLDPEGAHVVRLSVTKNNYGPPTAPIHLVRMPECGGGLRPMSATELAEHQAQRAEAIRIDKARRSGRETVPDEGLEERIFETIRKHPNLKSRTAVIELTKGQRKGLLRVALELLEAGRIEIGKGGCRVTNLGSEER